jgi:chaperonin cofactor prefoldin
MDTELAIESGEILLKNRKMTREEAISKLKEAKELMEIDMMTKEEFEKLKKKLRPIIMKRNN